MPKTSEIKLCKALEINRVKTLIEKDIESATENENQNGCLQIETKYHNLFVIKLYLVCLLLIFKYSRKRLYFRILSSCFCNGFHYTELHLLRIR